MTFAVVLALGVGYRAEGAQGDQGAEPLAVAASPTPQQTKEALESPATEPLEETVITDLEAAHELPHRDLARAEALELAEAVFSPALESAGGVFDEIEPQRFLSDFAAVVPVSTLPEPPGQEIGEPETSKQSEQATIVESTLPLRTENADGAIEPVDLSLERSEGELTPENPLAEIGLPTQLGEGISLPGVDVQIEVADAPDERAPTNVKGEYAFYPNVAENTDLVAAPTPSGLEMLTSIRSADAAEHDLSTQPPRRRNVEIQSRRRR